MAKSLNTRSTALVASAARWAFWCLILAASSAAIASMPTLTNLSRADSSEFETPLENDDGLQEAALPRVLPNQWRLPHRLAEGTLPRRRCPQCCARRVVRSGHTDGHRLANGLTAPLRC